MPIRLLLCGTGCLSRRNEPAGTMFNICHVNPHEKLNPEKNLTEICYPVKKK